ncbi:hypothetical protein BGZ96_005925 [Linnemannia gamsii]|uniref:Autophagy-related protein 16 domain-containing protein n=1 Tax=Linnemannia gamsii TaxID=64522 RepID=A0ABQ7K397_9FUNG|nr:hypothetical protein BGZ96_005925 [Linnemannia gamsii]
MVESYNGLVQKLTFYVDQNKHLESSAQSSKDQHDKMARQVNVLREQGSPMNQKKSAELEAQVARLKEEQAEHYKSQATNTQRLLDMNDVLHVKEANLAQGKEDIRRLTESNTFLARKNQEMVELVNEKNVTIQVIQDELTTLQLEMSKLDERQRDLERENAQLLQRWLKKMNEEADRMNAGNAFLEKSMGPESPTQSNWRGASSIFSIIPQISSKKFTAHDAEVNTVALSNGGSMAATGSNDKKIRIWDIKTGSLKSTLTGCLQSVMCVSFNATDELLLGASNDNAARLWHLGTGRPRHTLTGHIGKVFSARFNPDSSKVVSGSHDRTIKVWDLQKGYCIRTMFTFASVNDVCLLDFDGSTIASGHLDNNLRFWDARSGNCVKEVTGIHMGQITSVCPSTDGSQILTNSRDNTLRILDVRTYETVSVLHADGYKTGTNWSKACFSPDGQYVVSGKKTVKEQSSPIVGVSWVNSTVVSAEKDKTVVIWGTTARRPTIYEK